MSNLLLCCRKTKKFLSFSKALTITLLFSLIAAIILIPDLPAFSDDEEDILLYIPAIIAGSAGWRNTTLSHPIPMTYDVYDDEIRQCRIVQVDDGYWIAYARYSSVDEKYFFILKTNLEGRTMIPPFLLTKLTRTDDSASNYRFAIIPREEGGVQVLTTENGYGSTGPATLYDYMFDRHGKIIRSLSIMKELDRYNQEFKSLWATRTADGRTVFVAFSYGSIRAGVYTDNGESLNWEVEPNTSDPNYFAAHFDADLDRLYILYSNFYDPGYTRMTRWALNGTRDKDVDLSSQFGAVGRPEAYQLMDTPEGLLVSLPGRVSENPYRFFLLNPDCTVKKEVAIDGLSVQVCDSDYYSCHAVTLDDRNVVRIAGRRIAPAVFTTPPTT